MRGFLLGIGLVVIGCSPRVFGGDATCPAPPPPAPPPAPPPCPKVVAGPAPPVASATAPVASATAPTPIAAPDPDGIAGQYRIAAAANPGGGTYQGSVAITRSGDVYHLGWTIAGSAGYTGVGLHVGNVLGVGWSTSGAPGVVVYKVNGGKLDGRWASGSASGVGTEVLQGPAGLSGTYRITTGKNPDGSSYTGSVKITKKGDVYQLAWSIPGTSYVGVGILKDHVLGVGWGQSTPPGVVVYGVGGSTLDGVWANPSDTHLGKERLERK